MDLYFTPYVSPDVSRLISSYIGLTPDEVNMCTQLTSQFQDSPYKIIQKYHADLVEGNVSSSYLGEMICYIKWNMSLPLSIDLEIHNIFNSYMIFLAPQCRYCRGHCGSGCRWRSCIG